MRQPRLPLLALALLALLTLLPLASPATAQTDQRCFPETGQCIAGPIRAYWERNGGLAVFGLPITPRAAAMVEGASLEVQWFERDRLEIQPNGMVTAGRLGVERLEQLGTPWQQGPSAPAGPGCTAFPETGHQICGAFAAYWRANGGLERFGFPVTGEFVTELEGRPYTVQYFERRRFELHPEVGPNTVLLGLLGREVFTARQGQPQPQPPAATPESIVESFAAAGLPVSNITTTNVLPTLIESELGSCRGIRFDVEGDKGARVIICGDRAHADRLVTYYRALGDASPLFFSHVHQDGSLVFQMNGEIAAETFQRYVAALP